MEGLLKECRNKVYRRNNWLRERDLFILVQLHCVKKKNLLYVVTSGVVVLLCDRVSWSRQSACWWRRWAGKQWSSVTVRSASPAWRRTHSSPASATCWRESGATGCRLNRYSRSTHTLIHKFSISFHSASFLWHLKVPVQESVNLKYIYYVFVLVGNWGKWKTKRRCHKGQWKRDYLFIHDDYDYDDYYYVAFEDILTIKKVLKVPC